MTESTRAMLTIAISELEAAHDAATAEQGTEAIVRTERAARLLRCVQDLERIDAEERERVEEARRHDAKGWSELPCVGCGAPAGHGPCPRCRDAAPTNHSATKGLSYSL